MSYMRNGRQVHPDELQPAPLSLDDAWEAARAIINADHLSESERLRLMWQVYKAAQQLPAEA